MDASIKLFTALILSPIVMLGMHAIFSRLFLRYRPHTHRYIVFIISVTIGHIPMGTAIWNIWFHNSSATPLEAASAWIYALIVYNAMAYSYFHIFNMSETARRIRILSEIDKAGRLKASDIVSFYGVKNMLDARIDRLIAIHQIKQHNGRYFLDQKLLYVIARGIAGWRRFIGFPSSKGLL